MRLKQKELDSLRQELEDATHEIEAQVRETARLKKKSEAEVREK